MLAHSGKRRIADTVIRDVSKVSVGDTEEGEL